jgi:hypothetical protein
MTVVEKYGYSILGLTTIYNDIASIWRVYGY